ncbi:fungal-specific transcription factor domain-containing protein [Whalleya microplaca]|nr:fungal-specific transcription factor domain-containing protein [Whalleya microplaca]
MSASNRVEHDDADTVSSETAVVSPARLQRHVKRRRTGSHGYSTQEFGLMRDNNEMPRFIGSGSGIHLIRTVYAALSSRFQDQRSFRNGPIDLVPGEDDQLIEQPPTVVSTPGTQARAPLWQEHEIAQDTEGTCPNVDFDNLVQWTKSYFENWHSAFPFLHGPEILEIMEEVATHGIGNATEADVTIIRAIISISLADSRQLAGFREPIPANLVFLSLDDIASNMVFTLGSPASLKNIQAALCVELFLVSMLKFNMASRLGGVIARMAFHLGLHRCPCRYSNFNVHQTYMRKRIWWSMYCLERMVCQSLGLPLDIRDDDVDVCFLDKELHQVETCISVDSNTPTSSSVMNKLQLLTLLSKHSRLRGSILELRNKTISVRNDTVERALFVQADLVKWENEVHEIVADEGDDSLQSLSSYEGGTLKDGSISTSYKILLDIMKHESTITLNRPLLASDQEAPASQAALQACISASRSIIDKIDRQQDDPHQSSPRTPSQNILVWPLLTWSVWMSCFILTYAALEEATTTRSAHRYAMKSLRILRKLADRGTTWPESCATAVEHLMSTLEQRQEDVRHRTLKGTLDIAVGNSTSRTQCPRDARGVTHLSNRRQAGARNPDRSHPNIGRDKSIPSVQRETDQNLMAFRESTQQRHILQPNPMLTTQWREPVPPWHQETSRSQSVTMDHDTVEGAQFQEWLDPLNVLDFSNFAQSGTSDSGLGFRFDY